MASPLRRAALLLVAVVPVPLSATSQTALSLPAPSAPALAAPACGRPSDSDPARARIKAAIAARSPEARRDLAVLADSLEVVAADHADDPEARFLVAAAWGARAEVEGGRAKIRAARNAFQHAGRVLELAPAHPGAHFLLGRIHAGVMRMDALTRFLATRLLGGERLAGASWERAREHLEAAVEGAPCTADHRYELARLYAERGEGGRARRQVARLLALGDTTAYDREVSARGRSLIEELARRPSPQP